MDISTLLLKRHWGLWGVGAFAIVLAEGVAFLMVDDKAREYVIAWYEEALRDSTGLGFQKRIFVDADGAHRYLVFRPYRDPPAGERYPLIVSLNGRGENGRDGIAPAINGLAQSIRERLGSFPFVVLFAQCHDAEGTWDREGPAIQRTLGIINEVETEFGTDPDRVYLTGLSSGGRGVWQMASVIPDRFAAILPIAATASAENAVIRSGLPVYSALNRLDQPDMAEYGHETHHRLIAGGSESRYVDVAEANKETFAHNAWDYAFSSGRLFAWMMRQRRSTARSSDADVRLQPLSTESRELQLSETTRPILAAEEDFRLDLEFRPGETSTALELVGMVTDGEHAERTSWNLHMARPDRSESFLWNAETGSCVPGRIEAALSIRSGEWNTLQLERVDQELTVYVNEMLLLSTEDASPGSHLLARRGSVDLAGETESITKAAGLAIRYLRGRGIQGLDESNVEPTHTPIPRPELPDKGFALDPEGVRPCENPLPLVARQNMRARRAEVTALNSNDVTVQRVCEHWAGGSGQPRASELTFVLDRTGNGQWSRFQQALPHDEEWSCRTLLDDREFGVRQLWMSPTRSLETTMPYGRSREDHVYWMERLRKESVPELPVRFHELVLNGDSGVETIFGPEPDDLEVVLVRTSVTAQPGLDPPESLFNRIPQLIYQPFAIFGFGIDPATLSLTPGSHWANGERCVALERTHDVAGRTATDRFFFAPGRSFALMKYVHMADDDSCDVVTVSWDDAESPGLAGWTVASLRPEDPVSRSAYPADDAVVHFGIARVTPPSRQTVPEWTGNPTRDVIVCDRTSSAPIWQFRAQGSQLRRVSEAAGQRIIRQHAELLRDRYAARPFLSRALSPTASAVAILLATICAVGLLVRWRGIIARRVPIHSALNELGA